MTNNLAPVAVKKVYFVLRFAVRRGPEAWVKSVRFADGPGMRVKNVTFTAKREEAAPLSRAHAHAIGEQFCHRFVYVYTTDGNLHAEATAELTTALTAKRNAILQARAEMRAEWNAIFAEALEVIPGLRKALGR